MYGEGRTARAEPPKNRRGGTEGMYGEGQPAEPNHPKKEKPRGKFFHWGFAKLFSQKAFFGFASWSMPRLAGVARAVTYVVCSFACSLQNPALPHTAVQKINRSSTSNEACTTIHFLCQAFFFVKESGQAGVHQHLQRSDL